MRQLGTIMLVIVAVLMALAANTVSVMWAKGENKYSLHLLLLFIFSPLVFIFFGLVANRLGVSITSAVVDATLTILTIVVGLTYFKESKELSPIQIVGIVVTIVGVFLMLYKKHA
jgi:multidrug transporter EmrE-like cation transporter